MANATASADDQADQLKALQNQVTTLQTQLQLTNLQQTQGSAEQTAILTALKTQVTAQSDLDKASSQAGFAKLAGIKAGLDTVGAPAGKEGTITVGTGTSGALLLSLRTPMLEGIEASAATIVAAVKEPVYIGTDAQVQTALQSSVTETSLIESIDALDNSIKDIQSKHSFTSTAFFPTIAAAGLVLNTLVGFEKFFRVDTTYSVFDSSDDAQQILLFMIEKKLSETKNFRNLSTISIDDVLDQAKAAQESLRGVKQRYDTGSAIASEVDKLKPSDATRPLQDVIDKLKANLAVAKALLDALHPAVKPDGFWSYVQGLIVRKFMRDDSNKYINRLVVSAKAQTVQVVKKRIWRSDEIYGRADMQVDYRIIAPSGKLIDSGLSLASFDSNKPKAKPLYNFPTPLAPTPPAPTR